MTLAPLTETAQVVTCGALAAGALERLVRRYGMELTLVEAGAAIAGSYWGAPEAGLVGNRLYLRHDTPLHSVLHEISHFVCMDAARRQALDTDAGGSDLEECAVCYLQILLASQVGVLPRRLMRDMDQWGYSFRLGSTGQWFASDAAEAREWLFAHGVIDAQSHPTFELRGSVLTCVP